MARNKNSFTDHVEASIDTYAPPIALLCKLGSIAVHIDEALGEGGHDFDIIALRQLLGDRDVQTWIEAMTKAGFLPQKRNRK